MDGWCSDVRVPERLRKAVGRATTQKKGCTGQALGVADPTRPLLKYGTRRIFYSVQGTGLVHVKNAELF